MAKSISVEIHGKKYNLLGEDEELAKVAAKLVTEEIEELKQKHDDHLPNQTLYVLAALNIAKKYLRYIQHTDEEITHFLHETSRIKEFLSHNVNA